MTKIFTEYTIDEQADILADYLPNDVLFAAKKIEGTELRKFLKGCAHIYKKAHDVINEVGDQYDIQKTTDFIEEWEAAVGIPDECFDTSGTLADRRKQILFKIAGFNVQTEQDFIDLGAAFGLTVTIDNSVSNEIAFEAPGIALCVPPYDVPFTPCVDKTPFHCWAEKLVAAHIQPQFKNV